MIPALNGILFFITILFGLNTVFIAEQTHLTLDFESKTGTIEYFDLKTPSEAAEYAEEGLNKIDNSTKFNKKFTQLKLDSKKIEKVDGKLNVRLNFSFDNQNELMYLLRFNKTQYEQSTASDKFYYHLLPSEELISTNGSDEKTEETVELIWDKESKLIKLELTQKDDSTGLMRDTKSISKYWKK